MGASMTTSSHGTGKKTAKALHEEAKAQLRGLQKGGDRRWYFWIQAMKILLLPGITSQAVRDPFDVESVEWQQAGLFPPSIVRVHKMATIGKRLVERRSGVVTCRDLTRVWETIRQLWALARLS
jgi:hypothetical protein